MTVSDLSACGTPGISTAPSIRGSQVTTLVVACDAGMGSSVVLVSTLKRQLRKNQVYVSHSPVSRIPAGADVVLTREALAQRARSVAPGAVVVPFEAYQGDPAFTRVLDAIQNDGTLTG